MALSKNLLIFICLCFSLSLKAQKPDSVVQNPNSIAHKLNSIAQKPNSTTQKLNSIAQNPNSITQKPDSILKNIPTRLGLNDSSNYTPDLFLHLDKTIYLTNESIWFSAYLIHGREINSYHTLHLILVNDMAMKVVATQNFVLDGGLSGGSFSVPDSLQTGQYSIIAYTNRFTAQKAEHIFRQPIHIVGTEKDPFKITFSGVTSGDSLKLTAKILTTEGGNAAGRIVSNIYADGQFLKQIQQKIDDSGAIKFAIPLRYGNQSLEVQGEIKNEKNKMNFKLPLNWSSSFLQVALFPESGELVDGQPAKVSYRIKNTLGKAISARCSLLEDEKPIVSFSSDIYGRGIFSFTPLFGKIYIIKCEDENEIPLQQFPAIRKNAWSLHLPNGIITNGVMANEVITDTLKIAVGAPLAGSEGFVIVHNSRELFYSSHIALPQSTGRLSIDTKDWPQGMAMISLFDQQGALQCERPILLKRKNNIKTTISLDSVNYHSLSKVTIHIKLSDDKGDPLKGLFSFSATLAKVITSGMNDILRFDNYDRFLMPFGTLPPATYLQQELNIENALLQQQKNWNERLSIDRPEIGKSVFNGHVLYMDKKIKKPVNLLLSGVTTQTFLTNPDGTFVLPYLPLRAEAGKKALLSVVGKSPAGYRILMDNPLNKLNNELAKRYFRLNEFTSDDLSVQEKQLIRSSSIINLKEVTIKSKREEMKGYHGTPDVSGNCRDYVCYLGFLNCIFHPRGTHGTIEAVDGEKYYIEGLTGTETIVYHCQFKGIPPYMQSLSATAFPQKFYNFNLTDDTSPEILNRTTLHWQPFMTTDNNGEAVISFYTNKLTGKFIGVIQGISQTGVFSAEVGFNVVK